MMNFIFNERFQLQYEEWLMNNGFEILAITADFTDDPPE